MNGILTLLDPDNVDPFNDDFNRGGGFQLTKDDSVAFLKKMAAEAKRYGMSVGLKNAEDILPNVTDIIQFAVNEVCPHIQLKTEHFIDNAVGMYHIRIGLQTIRAIFKDWKASIPLRIYQVVEKSKYRPHRQTRDAECVPAMGQLIQ